MSWLARTFFAPRQRREQKVFDVVYREQAPRLFRRLLGRGWSRPLVEEVVHEAFLAYWEKFHAPALRGESHVPGVEEPFSWLLRVARNKAVDAHRRSTVAREKQETVSELASSSGEGAPLEERELLHRALNALKPRDVELLLCREVEGMSYDELAQALSLERGSVGTLLRRARAALLKAYDQLQDVELSSDS